jgi:2-keto-4-pentenoate hydratase/2-oxohepta-3-ene-1,7-dioic acid hydratase in catechol pathway
MTKWLRFVHQGEPAFGCLNDAGNGIERHAGNIFATPDPIGETTALNGVELLTPVVPSKIVAIWNNSRASAEKQNLTQPPEPLYFIKAANSYLAPGGAIRKPASYDGRVIYEAELGVVIGKTAKDVSQEEAADVVFGYTCVNDVTALQIIHEDPTFPQWARAKSFDTFAPFGPWIETDIDAARLGGLNIRAELGGRERQNYPVSDLFYSPLELVSLLSRDMTLYPGDIISCGTGPGALPMKPGTKIDIFIDDIGRLENEYTD